MIRGRDLAIELVKGIGAPVEGCTSVELSMPIDGIAILTLSYYVTAEAMHEAGAAVLAAKDLNP